MRRSHQHVQRRVARQLLWQAYGRAVAQLFARDVAVQPSPEPLGGGADRDQVLGSAWSRQIDRAVRVIQVF